MDEKLSASSFLRLAYLAVSYEGLFSGLIKAPELLNIFTGDVHYRTECHLVH